MSKLLPSGRSRLALKLGAAATVAALMSGCSTDSSRLGDPFGNPFSSASNDAAPVSPPRRVASNDVIPAGRTPPVTSQALAPRAVASTGTYRSSSTAAFKGPVSQETTGSIDPGPVRSASGSSFGGWTTTGGTPIEVAQGESAEIIANRYGVPAKALLQVNGLTNAAEVRPGTRITVPVYSASVAPRSVPLVAARTEERRVASAETTQVLRPPTAARQGAALMSQTPARSAIAPLPKQTLASRSAPKAGVVARSETLTTATTSTAGRVLGTTTATTKTTVATAKGAPQKLVTTSVQTTNSVTQPVSSPKAIVKTASVTTTKTEKVAVADVPKAAPEPVPVAASAQPASAQSASAEGSPEFRWPARGRIIQTFKGGSGGNDGINIAVPEGTSVKAAEGGVVAYAGSELKGYGNLVLIRHPNGFVSAYANNGEIDVKRGETVKRGQQIAKSGQSGNVSSPQLHFELRKGSTPVDPTQYLAGL